MQTSFPQPEIRHEGLSTRALLNQYDFNTAREWTSGTDMDDLIDMYNDSNILNIEHTSIWAILLFNKYAVDDSLIKLIEVYQEYGVDPSKFIDMTCNNIKKLYYYLKTFPKVNKINEINEDFYIYSGIEPELKPFKDQIIKMNIDNVISLPLFISTSVLPHVAYRFSDYSGVVMKIKISKKNFDKFNYTYFGKRVLDVNDPTNTQESEILLNLNTKLKLIKKHDSISYTFINPNNNRYETKVITIYEFEYIDTPDLNDSYFTMLNSKVRRRLRSKSRSRSPSQRRSRSRSRSPERYAGKIHTRKKSKTKKHTRKKKNTKKKEKHNK